MWAPALQAAPQQQEQAAASFFDQPGGMGARQGGGGYTGRPGARGGRCALCAPRSDAQGCGGPAVDAGWTHCPVSQGLAGSGAC